MSNVNAYEIYVPRGNGKYIHSLGNLDQCKYVGRMGANAFNEYLDGRSFCFAEDVDNEMYELFFDCPIPDDDLAEDEIGIVVLSDDYGEVGFRRGGAPQLSHAVLLEDAHFTWIDENKPGSEWQFDAMAVDIDNQEIVRLIWSNPDPDAVESIKRRLGGYSDYSDLYDWTFADDYEVVHRFQY